MAFRIRRSLFLCLLLWGIIALTILQFQKHPSTLKLRLSSDQNVTNYRFPDKPDDRKKPTSLANLLQRLKNIKPKTDTNRSDDVIAQIQQDLPNLPISYWNQIRNQTIFSFHEPCATFPSILDLEFNNVYWQTLHSSNGTFHLYGAYYDVRKFSRIGPAVRILGMIDRLEPTVRTYCQFWFSGQLEPVVVETMEYKHIWANSFGLFERLRIYRPYLIACPLPKTVHHLIPVSVSLVERACDKATNNLRVVFNKADQKEGFAVCVKGLDFLDDISVRLVEWIELLSMLGADKIFFYKLHVHPNVSKVLDHYANKGKVQVTPITLAGGQPNAVGLQHLYLTNRILHKRLNELIPYNDCLYRNMYRYEYVVLLDVDEVIVPMRTTNWRELMDSVLQQALAEGNETRVSYVVRHVYFLDEFQPSHGWSDDVPRYMHTLQHVYRSKYFSRPYDSVKCFHNPERTLMLHNHFPLACLGQYCAIYLIDVTDAQLHHYRTDCVEMWENSCNIFKQNTVIDTTIWRYKDLLVNRTTTTLYTLGFLEEGYSNDKK